MGDDTWVPLGSGYGRVKGVLAWASCWAAFVGRLGGPQRVRGVKGGRELGRTGWAARPPSFSFSFSICFSSLSFASIQI